MNEPSTDTELSAALKNLRVEVEEVGDGEFVVIDLVRGGRTTLDAEDWSSALFEAWNLMKP